MGDRNDRDGDALEQRFAAEGPRLRALAHRMLGSWAEAEDAVQESWLRLQRVAAGDQELRNLPGWLTTTVGRICLDGLRDRTGRREEPLGLHQDLARTAESGNTGPEGVAELADTVGAALLTVLDTLTPPERLAFVLHDLFGVPFEEVATVVDRTPSAARQLASRARRRVRGHTGDDPVAGEAKPGRGDPLGTRAEAARRRRVVTAFLAASREGDFAGLLAVLDPDVHLRADPTAVAGSAAARAAGYAAPVLAERVEGADAVARVFAGRAAAAREALVDGVVAAVWAPGGVPRTVFELDVVGDRIVRVTVVGDPRRLSAFRVEPVSVED